jgi:hypothetical protein
MFSQVAPPNVATRLDSVPAFDVGGLFYDATNKRVYKYVKFAAESSDAALTQYQPLYWADKTHTTVTGVMSESLANDANSVAGVYVGNAVVVGSIPSVENKYLFILVGGPTKVYMNTDNDAAINMGLIGGATGVFDTTAIATLDATKRRVGIITVAVNTQIAEAFITIVPTG